MKWTVATQRFPEPFDAREASTKKMGKEILIEVIEKWLWRQEHNELIKA